MSCSPTPFKIIFPDQRPSSGPDGQGWNRLSIFALTPTDRCMLRPQTRQAFIDLARGMARLAPITTFSECEGTECESCRFNMKRDPWVDSWFISDDTQRDGVWVMGSNAPDACGHYFSGWEALAQAFDVPLLQRVIDPHWGAVYVAAKPSSEAPAA